MSKVLGFIEERKSPTTGEIGYMGEIEVGGISGRCALVPVAVKRSENYPDYNLKIERNGRFFDFGAAWLKVPQAGGEEFLSITVEHETALERPVYCAAFPPSEDDDGDQWRIVWGRARRRNVNSGAAEPLADQVPY